MITLSLRYFDQIVQFFFILSFNEEVKLKSILPPPTLLLFVKLPLICGIAMNFTKNTLYPTDTAFTIICTVVI